MEFKSIKHRHKSGLLYRVGSAIDLTSIKLDVEALIEEVECAWDDASDMGPAYVTIIEKKPRPNAKPGEHKPRVFAYHVQLISHNGRILLTSSAFASIDEAVHDARKLYPKLKIVLESNDRGRNAEERNPGPRGSERARKTTAEQRTEAETNPKP